MITIDFICFEKLFEVHAEIFKIRNIDNNLLKTEVLEQQVRVTNNSSMSFFEDTIFQPKQNSEGEKLINKINEFAIEKGLVIDNYWSHVHQPLESAGLHNHIPSILSFCYYVCVPIDSGSISFEFENGEAHTLYPQESHFFVFPSWVKHKVNKNLSNSVRISIAGNFKKAL
jgi:hypothetical protein